MSSIATFLRAQRSHDVAGNSGLVTPAGASPAPYIPLHNHNNPNVNAPAAPAGNPFVFPTSSDRPPPQTPKKKINEDSEISLQFSVFCAITCRI